ncbi:ankyrin repeat domain-containing protein [Wolbachia endosymbiont (group A) of Eristalinus aeneus]|uniref:ankyrin repeat domain-containing protein n=1 Tax=Wolbachia endosymbiont (group A) of Eristalinus aeneus TaxID=3066145 RepID=UPI003132B8F4
MRSTLYLRELVEQIDEDLGIKPVSMVIKDESDLLIKLYISATGLQQDIITVRLKDALVNKWYKKLQIIFNNALMEIGDGLDLEPSLFVSDKKITLVRPQDVEERNKIIVSKRAGHYTYLHDKYDLIVTNAFDAKIEANELCVIRFKDFYKEPKMKTLSIRFADKEILLNNEIDKIYNSESAEKLNYVSSVLNLQKSPLPLEANVNITDVEILKQKLDLYRQLLTAVQNRDLNKIKDLISKGADIDVKDNSGRTPEDEERYTNSDTMRQVFMQAHLDKELLLTVKNEKDLKTISDLIAKDIDDRTHGGFYYTWSGNLDTVEFLVSTDVSVNATDKYGCTLLHWAALKGHSDIAKFLVDKEANVNAKDILGRTPIHFAVMNNHKDIQDVYGRGSTYTTAESSDEEVIQLFLMRGASINEADKNGETPLHLASWGGHLDTLQHLINNGANISTKDSSGKTPLDIARDKGHNNLVQCLQQTQLILDKQLLSAIGNSDLNKVRGLVAQGANIDTNNKNGNTLLYSAAEIGDLNLVKLLLDNGANIEAKNGEYQATPLHGAVENYRIDVVKLLLNRGANVNAEDKDNWTPLHYAADTNSLDIAKVLVDAHANLGAKGNYGKTPLDIAKDKGHNNIVEYLEKKFREERGEPLQRKRRHHHGDHARHHMSRKPLAIDSSNQPEIATSSAIKPSSWINDLFDWVKGSVGGLLNSKPTLSRETSSTSSPILQVDAKMDVNGTIMLLDVLIRKVTGQKYISTVDQSISPLEAQGYTLNITKGFEKVVEQAGLKSGVSMHRLNIDFVEIQKEVTGKIMSGKFNEISGVLRSYVEKACPGREAGCPGKLSPKKFDKFMTIFDNKLDIALNQSIQQILHGGDGKLEVRGAEKQQMSLEPQSYLSNASIQNHSKVSTCLSDVGVTKLGNTLSK